MQPIKLIELDAFRFEQQYGLTSGNHSKQAVFFLVGFFLDFQVGNHALAIIFNPDEIRFERQPDYGEVKIVHG